jgi:hypothetical protein
MKKFTYTAVAMLVLGSALGAMFITQDEAKVSGVLTALKLESVPQKDPKLMGAPPQFKVTKATIEYLQKLEKDGKVIEVQGNGELKVK